MPSRLLCQKLHLIMQCPLTPLSTMFTPRSLMSILSLSDIKRMSDVHDPGLMLSNIVCHLISYTAQWRHARVTIATSSSNSRWFYVLHTLLQREFLDHELISYRYSSSCCSCSCWGRPQSLRLRRIKSDRDEIWPGIVLLPANTHRMTESDFWYDVILSRWRRWRHFT